MMRTLSSPHLTRRHQRRCTCLLHQRLSPCNDTGHHHHFLLSFLLAEMVIGYWFEPTSFPAVPLTVLIVTQEYSANWVTDMFGSHNNDTSISPGPGAQVQVIEYKKLHGGLPSDGVRDRDANSCKVGNRARCTWSHQCHIPVGLRDRT
jgi:hypothetical protein